MKSWFLLNIDSTHKALVHTYLNEINVEFYSPRMRVQKTNMDDDIETDGLEIDAMEDVFPDYIFVFFDEMSQAFEHILAISNVCKIVFDGNRPAVLSMGFVNIFKLIEKNKNHWRAFNKVTTNSQLFQVTDAELKMIDVILDEAEGEERVDILMHLFEDYQIA